VAAAGVACAQAQLVDGSYDLWGCLPQTETSCVMEPVGEVEVIDGQALVFVCPDERYGWMVEYAWIKPQDGTTRRVSDFSVQRVAYDAE
jgi:hypothetical protein